MKSKTLAFSAVFVPEKKGYSVSFPDFPKAHTQGVRSLMRCTWNSTPRIVSPIAPLIYEYLDKIGANVITKSGFEGRKNMANFSSRVARYIIFSGVLLLSTDSGFLCAVAAQAPGPVLNAELIDGSVHPELIPDDLAFRMVLASLALPDHPTIVDLFKQKTRVGRIGLAPADLDQFNTLLGSFSTEYSNWQSAISSQDAAAALADRDRLIGDFVLLVEQHLSVEGVARFKKYVRGEKKKMTLPL